ncbi:hypothetical protein ABIB26_004773 [Arthrobacter sp. UYEF20]
MHDYLHRNKIDDSGWNIQGITQESTQMTNGHKLELHAHTARTPPRWQPLNIHQPCSLNDRR